MNRQTFKSQNNSLNTRMKILSKVGLWEWFKKFICQICCWWLFSLTNGIQALQSWWQKCVDHKGVLCWKSKPNLITFHEYLRQHVNLLMDPFNLVITWNNLIWTKSISFIKVETVLYLFSTNWKNLVNVFCFFFFVFFFERLQWI